MDPSNETQPPAPEEPKVEDTLKAPEVSVAADDTSTPSASTTTAAPVGDNPGRGLGIASLIVSIIGVGLVGIILGIIGLNKSKKAGQKNGLALAGIIVGALNVVVVTIVVIIISMGAVQLASKCAELGGGTHVESGVTYTCN